MTTEQPNGKDLVTVELLDVPVALWHTANDEANDLVREFTLIEIDESEAAGSVPARLLELIDELQSSYANVGDEQTEQLRRADGAGEETIERLVYRLPPGVRGDVVRLATSLDDADEYCRRGRHLLSLAPSRRSKAFRDWFLSELTEQLDGRPPTPWGESRYAREAAED